MHSLCTKQKIVLCTFLVSNQFRISPSITNKRLCLLNIRMHDRDRLGIDFRATS